MRNTPEREVLTMTKEFWCIAGIVICFVCSIVGMALSQGDDT